jgi:hypothetical protein
MDFWMSFRSWNSLPGKDMNSRLILILLLAMCIFGARHPASMAGEEADPSDKTDTCAEEVSGGAPGSGAGDERKSVLIVPFKFTTDDGAHNGDFTVLNIRPIYTFNTNKWYLINRVVVPLTHLDENATWLPDQTQPVGGKNLTGLGDISYIFAVEPRGLKPVSIAGGMVASFPTATEDQLGSGKWGAGPALVILARHDRWGLTMITRQLWSLGGDADRSNISNLAVEPIFNWKINDKWYLFTDPIIAVNWMQPGSNRWIVPVGGGAGRLFRVGNQIIDLKLEGYYHAVKPDAAPKAVFSFTLGFIFPNLHRERKSSLAGEPFEK